MNCQIIVPGKVKAAWLRDGIADYKRRLSRYCSVSISEVEDQPDHIPIDQRKAKEAEQIRKRITGRSRVIALDAGGKAYDSPAFAAALARWFEQGGGRITFLIGGSGGLDDQLLREADERVSFSAMTYTHQMIRLLLLEQCYRGFRILNGEPYHK